MTNKVTTRRERYLFYRKRKALRAYKVRNKRRRGKPKSGKRGSMERDLTQLTYMPPKKYPHVVGWGWKTYYPVEVTYKKAGGSDDPPTWTYVPTPYWTEYLRKNHKAGAGALIRRLKAWPRLKHLPRIRKGRGRKPK